jgi:hypothetical protein
LLPFGFRRPKPLLISFKPEEPPLSPPLLF